eukprot:TRINITY_DN1315_c0_g1_i5.p1 TRINITY_DN1315_c0_g1~~TRINITY_DN1315_c0_g1_i5.p1  ORF type:complete len:231 (+),score=51.79 TRINITY_DN1315_c0_g1_i5:850-1542(+)
MRGPGQLLATFVTGQNPEEVDSVHTVAKDNKGLFLTTLSTNVNIAARWGSTGKVVPTAIFVSGPGNPTFVIWNEETETLFNAETLANFVKQAREGTYDSYLKSEPIPEPNDGPVKILVGKNFDKIVYSKEQNVFVEFYAPWCGHCRKLAPVWDELGAFYTEDSEIVIAKMDATANALPKGIAVQGYPTLIFFDKNNNAVPYSGDRDLEDLKNFIATNRVSGSNEEEKTEL